MKIPKKDKSNRIIAILLGLSILLGNNLGIVFASKEDSAKTEIIESYETDVFDDVHSDMSSDLQNDEAEQQLALKKTEAENSIGNEYNDLRQHVNIDEAIAMKIDENIEMAFNAISSAQSIEEIIQIIELEMDKISGLRAQLDEMNIQVLESMRENYRNEIRMIYDELKLHVNIDEEDSKEISGNLEGFFMRIDLVKSIEELEAVIENERLIITQIRERLDAKQSDNTSELKNLKDKIREEIIEKYREIMAFDLENEDLQVEVQMTLDEFIAKLEEANTIEEVEALYNSEIEKFNEYGEAENIEAENPDNLPGPIEIEAPFIDENPQAEIQNTLRSMSHRSGGLEPGEVKMTKTATPVEGMVNAWEINIRVEGQNLGSSSDIVLLLDTSASMKGRKLSNAKEAAIAFANQLLDSNITHTRIAVVSFSDKVKVEQELTNNKNAVVNAIEGLEIDRGTFTQAGMVQAEAILANSNANLKNIVLLSDGVPTYSYKLYEPDDYIVRESNKKVTGSHMPKSAFDYSKVVGDGTEMLTRYAGFMGFGNKYYNHGNSTIAESRYAKENGNIVYTIAFEADRDGSNILNKMASDGKAFTASGGDLENIFNEIGGDIILAAKEAKVTDPMGKGFSVVGNVSDIKVSEGTDANYDLNSKTIYWTIDTLSQSVGVDSDLKYATMDYTVEIGDDILNVISGDGSYSTNGVTVLEYIDKDDKKQRIEAVVPSVKPILLILEKKLINSLGFEINDSDERVFDINATNGKEYNKTYELVAGQKRVMTNLKYEDEYIVKEIFEGDRKQYADDYSISYTINGADTNKFKVVQGDSNKQIVITNVEMPLGELTVTKEFDPEVTRAKRSTTAPKFKFELIGPNKANGKNSLDGISGLTLENGKYVFELKAGESKTFKNLPYAEYQVVEMDSKGFEPSYSTTGGKVTLTIDNKIGEVIVTNTPKDDDKIIDIEAKKIWNGGKVEDHTAVDLVLIKNGVDTDIKPTSIEQDKDEENIFNYTWKGLQKYEKDGKPIEYTIKEPTVPANYTSKVEGFTVTNTYEIPKDGEYEVTKKWEGDEKVTRPTMNVELWRIYKDKEEKVEGAEVKEFSKDKLSAKWTGLEETDGEGDEYTYFAKEDFEDKTDIKNENWTLGKYDENTKSFTNSVKAPTGKLTIKIVLENEFIPIARRSLLNSTPLMFKVKVTGPYNYEKIVELKAGQSVTLENLYSGEYKVEEIETHDYTPSYAPEDGKIEVKADKTSQVTITNKNTGGENAIDITVTKVWVGGTETKPEATIELWRKGLDLENEEINEKVGEFKATVDEKTKTFTNLAKHDPSGSEFEYYVKEPIVPTNYTAKVEGFIVTNTYEIPKDGEYEVTKKWEGDDKVTRPTMNVELWRKIGTEEGKVEGAEVKKFTDSITTAKWTNLEETDSTGDEYTYFAKEDFKDKTDIKNENWTLGKYDENTKSFTNSVKAPTGKLTIKKVLENEFIPIARRSLLNSTPLMFKVKVTGPYNYEKIVELKAGQSVTLENLYSGEYKVEEIETHDYTPSYAPEDGKVEVKADKTSQVTITNKNTGGENTIDITVTKVWVGGTETKPEATIELWRKGLDLENEEINEKVGEFKATVDEKTKTFTNLAKHDPSGSEFEYYVKEPTVPTNYTSKVEGFTVTNTYKYREDLSGIKTWNHGSNPLELQPEKVSIILKADGVEVDRVDVTEKDDWKYEFKGHPIENDEKTIEYTVEEVPVENYKSEISKFDIKNTFVDSIAKLSSTKTDNLDGSKVKVGDVFKYSITVKNIGEHNSKNIEITDRVPNVLDIISVTPKEATVKGQDIVFTIPNIKAGESFTMTIEVKVNREARNGQIIKNIAVVDGKDIPGREIESIHNNIIWWGYLDRENHYSYLVGYQDGTIRPEAEITRGEVATIFYRMMTDDARNRFRSSDNKYTDVRIGQWYNNAISTLSRAGALEGYPDGSFRPEENITRGEFAAMASRFLSDSGSLTDYKFTDIRGNWAESAIAKLAKYGLISGYPDGNFRPNKAITRAETTTLMNSILDRTPHEDNLLRGMVTWPDNNRGAWYYAQIQEATNSHEYERANVSSREKWIKLLPNRDWTQIER